MTSLAVNYGWTPELIQREKELKEKYGPGAHITPVETYGYSPLERTPQNGDCCDFSVNNKVPEENSNKFLEALGRLVLFAPMARYSLNQAIMNNHLMQTQFANDMALQAHQQAMNMHNQAVMMTTPGMGIVPM